MNVFIVFKTVFKFLIPFSIRNPKMVEFVGALLQPLQTVNGWFVDFVEGTRYDLRFNGQVVYLEHVINDQFDTNFRRIYIDDPAGQQVFAPYIFNRIEEQPPLYLFTISDAKPLLENIVLRNASELVVTTDFVVYVPVSIFTTALQVQISALIDKYRIAGKRYTFQTF